MGTCHGALARVVREVGDQLALEDPVRLWEDEEALRMTWELPVGGLRASGEHAV